MLISSRGEAAESPLSADHHLPPASPEAFDVGPDSPCAFAGTDHKVAQKTRIATIQRAPRSLLTLELARS